MSSIQRKKGEHSTSDEEEYQDAMSKASEEIVDEILGKHTDSLSLNEQECPEEKKKCDNNSDDEYHNTEKIDEPEKCGNNEADNTNQIIEDDLIDEEHQKELDSKLTEEEKAENKLKATQVKEEANELYKVGKYEESINLYTTALQICPTDHPNDRAILYANRAAAKIKQNSNNGAIDDCSQAILLNPNYIRALLRRAKLYEDTGKLDESFADYKKILELDPSNKDAGMASIRLPPIIQEKNEKLKEEMLSKLKDLGNMILKPFGLSTNNFQMQQDPTSGSYSINFQQNADKE